VPPKYTAPAIDNAATAAHAATCNAVGFSGMSRLYSHAYPPTRSASSATASAYAWAQLYLSSDS
jgi:hypothetical protein